jgi:hypothetical protein
LWDEAVTREDCNGDGDLELAVACGMATMNGHGGAQRTTIVPSPNHDGAVPPLPDQW